MSARPHVHLDAVGGVAGDMFVAAMLDALPALRDRVLTDVAAVLVAGGGAVELTEGRSGGVRALRFGLRAAHVAGHERDPHGHDPHGHDPHGHDPHGFGEMVTVIRRAALAQGTAEQAVAMLTMLAEVEARIHGVPIDQVHFHEIGDRDSLVDFVAAGSIAAALDGASWSISDLPKGGGLVRTQHGLLPVPAPATAALLAGFRWRDDGVPGERITPTGAAILRHLVGAGTAGLRAPGRLLASGTGAGTRESEGLPNVLRALVFETENVWVGVPIAERCAVISFDVDDMTGEEIAVAGERLRGEAGVLDLTVGSRIGKKGRPVQSFRLLVSPESIERVQACCFAETSTIGLRWRIEERAVLPRRIQAHPAAGGEVRVKKVDRPGGETTAKVESDDLCAHPGLESRRALKAAVERGEP